MKVPFSIYKCFILSRKLCRTKKKCICRDWLTLSVLLLVPLYSQLPLPCLNNYHILLADTVNKTVVFEGFFILGFSINALNIIHLETLQNRKFWLCYLGWMACLHASGVCKAFSSSFCQLKFCFNLERDIKNHVPSGRTPEVYSKSSNKTWRIFMSVWLSREHKLDLWKILKELSNQIPIKLDRCDVESWDVHIAHFRHLTQMLQLELWRPKLWRDSSNHLS